MAVGVFWGTVTNIAADRSYASIRSQQVCQIFDGKNVFVCQIEILRAGLKCGDNIMFTVCLSSRADPQACEIVLDIAASRLANRMRVMSKGAPHLQINTEALMPDSAAILQNFFCSGDEFRLYEQLHVECISTAKPRIGDSYRESRNSAVVALIRGKVEDFFQIRDMNTGVSFYPDAASYSPPHTAKFRSGEDIAVICSFGCSQPLARW
jgi:hypothetical protein